MFISYNNKNKIFHSVWHSFQKTTIGITTSKTPISIYAPSTGGGVHIMASERR